MELPAEAGALRAGDRWVADTFVPLALCAAARAGAELYAKHVGDSKQRKRLGEAGTRSWLNANRKAVVAAGNAAVQVLWDELVGEGECPLEILGWGTTVAKKNHLDDLVLRYRLAGRDHKMWVNHKLVKSEPTGLSRIGSIRATAAAAIGERLVRWEHLVPALVDALGTGRHLASLVLVMYDRGDRVDVMCYEPFTVFAYRDKQPVVGLHPDAWPVREGALQSDIYTRENSLVQACHLESDHMYQQAGRALVAAGVSTSEVVGLGAGRMLEEDARQRRELADEGEQRLADYVTAVGYTTVGRLGGEDDALAEELAGGSVTVLPARGLGLVPGRGTVVRFASLHEALGDKGRNQVRAAVA